jgi:hypothetical protein
MERPVETSLRATYRALLARGLETGEAANLTAFLHGLPSADFHWTLPEIEAIVRRRLQHAAEQRAVESGSTPDDVAATVRPSTTAGPRRSGFTHVIDPPQP